MLLVQVAPRSSLAFLAVRTRRTEVRPRDLCQGVGSGSAWPLFRSRMVSRWPYLGGGHVDGRPAVRCVEVDVQVLVRAVLAARMGTTYGTRVYGSSCLIGLWAGKRGTGPKLSASDMEHTGWAACAELTTAARRKACERSTEMHSNNALANTPTAAAHPWALGLHTFPMTVNDGRTR